jgi:hypothetical protein
MTRQKSTRQQIIALLEAAVESATKTASAVIHGKKIEVEATRRGRRYGRETYRYSATGTPEAHHWAQDKAHTVDWLMTQLDPDTIARGEENDRKFKQWQKENEERQRVEAAERVKETQRTEPLRVAIRKSLASSMRLALPPVIFNSFSARDVITQLKQVLGEKEYKQL